MSALREQFIRYLRDVGFISAGTNDDKNSGVDALPRCVLCAGLYPNAAQIQRIIGGKGKTQAVLVSLINSLTRYIL